MLEERINQDLKKAMLGGDTVAVTTLRSLKSVILYAKLETSSRQESLPDSALYALIRKEAQKRQESADLYKQGGNEAKAEAELVEKTIIENYLPAQLSEAEVTKLVDAAIAKLKAQGPVVLGTVIGMVKQQTAGRADGATIAKLVKERLAL